MSSEFDYCKVEPTSDSEDCEVKMKGNNNNNNNSGSPNDNDDEDDLVIKLRGLPWSCNVEDILHFFKDCKIQGGRDGIHLVSTPEGRSSGEAFVEIMECDMMDAIKKDHKNIGHRYIEVFKVNRREMDWVLDRSRPNHSNSNSFRINNNSDDNESFVRMRGLPFDCTKEDIARFFNGLDVVANGIQLMYVDGRSSGEAYVRFSSAAQAEKALQKDRQCIGRRYIELFRVGAAEMRKISPDSMVSRNSRPMFNNRPGPYDRDRGNHHQSGPNNRYGSHSNQRPNSRYFSKGFEEDTWNSYANEVGSWNRVNNSQIPSSGGRGRGHHGGSNAHCVLMRGLPFRANEADIRKFFDPLIPMGVHIIFDSQGRPSGSAKVQFACGDDMTRAMSKHKEKIFTRYIELFVNST